MTSINPLASGADPTWHRYRDNFPRHVLGVTRYLESQIMDRLAGEHGFRNLCLYYEPYISLVGNEGIRLTALAEILKQSRQAANQTANQIEAAGYIRRLPDPQDGRAKRIVLTPRGIQLREKGLDVASRLQREVAKIIGKQALAQSVAALATLCNAANITPPTPFATEGDAALIGLLPRFSEYLNRRLMELTIKRGHSGLKLSYGQILALIGPDGGRILQIAALQNVSKQAISAIANELEALNYIYREQDPEDARQVLLRFTGPGRKLIEDSVNSIDELENEMCGQIGVAALNGLRSAMRKLYFGLQPESAVFTDSEPDLAQLARELRMKLSPEAREHLVKLLRD